MKTAFKILILFSILSTACSKEGDGCKLHKKRPMKLVCPPSVYERSTLHLKVLNVHDLGVNASYGWLFPDMTPYSQTGGYGLDVSIHDADWEVQNITVQDEGNYTFSAADYGCGAFSATQYVKVLPLPIPCADNSIPNTIHIRDSLTDIGNTVPCIVQVHESDGELYLTFKSDPVGLYNLVVDFDYLPQRNSTFYLRNFYANSSESEMPFDKFTQASIVFIPPDATYNKYKLIPLTQDIYVTREGNQITLTLCDVLFKSTHDVKYVSAKLVFTI